jgi:hypothetical protein
LYAAAAPPALSAVCEWHLTSRLFSPHELDSAPESARRRALPGLLSGLAPTRSALGSFGASSSPYLLLTLASCRWMRETAAARPVLACGSRTSAASLREHRRPLLNAPPAAPSVEAPTRERVVRCRGLERWDRPTGSWGGCTISSSVLPRARRGGPLPLCVTAGIKLKGPKLPRPSISSASSDSESFWASPPP